MSKTSFDLTQVDRVEIESLTQKGSLRIHSKAKQKKLEKSIRRTKILTPIVINDKNEIVAGNARFEAAKSLGIKEVPVIQASHLTEEELKVFEIADNASVLDAKWNLPEVKIVLDELIIKKEDLELTFLETGEIDLFVSHGKTDNNAEEETVDLNNVEARVKAGDFWILGNHGILCGDATKPESYKNLLGEYVPNAVIADLPYNLDQNFIGNKGKKKHENFKMGSGEMSPDEFTKFLSIVIKNLQDFTAKPSCHMLFQDWRHIYELMTAAQSYEAFKALAIWDKQCPANGWYKSQHELVFVFQNGKGTLNNNSKNGKHGRNRSNIWSFKGAHVSNPEAKEMLSYHPTCKPVKMLEEAILDVTKPNEIVLDPFLGSGSSLLGCENTKRVCLGMEIDPHYCDVVIHRWEKLTGQKAQFEINFGGADNVR